ncbi:MAG: aldo/keto reductase [Sporomusaceae bacterium]|jgi:predicted aldo/keto reductase-like oxidoreductase|nr:aldo/keto reductase [Sporomusaceae bacterium]
MEYREIGKTGKKAGIIGLGLEHLDGAPFAQVDRVIKTALEHGVNYLDCFMPGQEVRENIAQALGTRRKDVYIQGHLGSTDLNQQYDTSRDLPTVKRYFEKMLRLFGGYIDFGMLFFVDTEADFKQIFAGGIADYAARLKQNGEIGHIGFGSHNPSIAKKVIETGLPEIMMFSINLAFDLCPTDVDAIDAMLENRLEAELKHLNLDRLLLYSLCQERGIGISVMKTLGAGKLISREHTPFSRPMTLNQCIHYALTRPAVFSALIGCQKETQVLDAIAYLKAAEKEKDYFPFLSELKNNFTGHCVYCNHCLPCPAEIDIAAVTKYLDIARLDEKNIPPSIRSHYANLPNNAADCTECGNCEKRCPFQVPVIQNMKDAAHLF